MIAKIISGIELANAVMPIPKEPAPGLAVVQVGNNPASTVYIKQKLKKSALAGIKSFMHHLPADISQTKLQSLIQDLNQDPQINGILVQLPLPEHINANVIIDSIHPTKDIDGFTPHNMGLLMQNRPEFIPCTPKGILHILKNIPDFDLTGKQATIIGRSNIVGKPMGMLLLNHNVTVTYCHSATKELESHTKNADIVIVAVGQAGLIKGHMLKSGSVVIDVGINKTANGKLVGDVDFASASQVAGWITPVPGGVGPMTVAMLIQNTYEAQKKQLNRP